MGALVENRFIGSVSLDEVIAFEGKLHSIVRRIIKGKKRAVLCTDLRACQVLRPDASDRIVKLMRNDNPHIVRNALLGQGSALLYLQVQRYISESGSLDRRRMFKDEAELLTWLGEVTTAAEQARLRTFLGSGPPRA